MTNIRSALQNPRTADDLLSGRRADVAPLLAKLIDAATCPATCDEVADEALALAHYRAATGRTMSHRRGPATFRSALSKLLATKLLALSVTGLASGGIALAAATGNVPEGLQHVLHSFVTGQVPRSQHESTSPNTTTHPTPQARRSDGTQPPSSGAAISSSAISSLPANQPGNKPSTNPGNKPSTNPGNKPSTNPGNKPSTNPGNKPTTNPGNKPATKPSHS